MSLHKPWRQRIDEAKARDVRFLGLRLRAGRFTADDKQAWWSFQTCPVGEVAAAYGLKPLALNAAGPDFSLRCLEVMFPILTRPSARKAERLFEEIRDAAIKLKLEEVPERRESRTTAGAAWGAPTGEESRAPMDTPGA